MYSEDEYIQLSSLQHFLFCPRQCALAYMEMSWQENELTALGRLFHYKAHEKGTEKRPGLLITRGLRIFSSILGLSGEADVVEFRPAAEDENGCKISGISGTWTPFPIEYKRGRPKRDNSDEVQLCAQAVCLEEMLNVKIDTGAIFYGKNRRRHNVTFTPLLRELTKKTAENVHQLLDSGITPKAVYSKKCSACSLIELCLPQRTSNNIRAAAYLKKQLGKFYEKDA